MVNHLYVVVCKSTDLDQQDHWYLAKREIFASYQAAEVLARTIELTRDPRIIPLDVFMLLLPKNCELLQATSDYKPR